MIHSSTVIPILPSISAISPPVLVLAAGWNACWGCSLLGVALRLVRDWLISPVAPGQCRPIALVGGCDEAGTNEVSLASEGDATLTDAKANE